MKTELVISASSDQADIALLEDGRLQELIKEKGDDSFSVGDVYLGTVKKLATGLNAAFVDVGYEKDAFLHYHDLGPQIKSWQTYLRRTLKGKQLSNITNFKAEPNIEKEGNIGDVLKQGDQILVQITKEPISTKGPRITAELSIAGRFVVLVPFSNRVSVSQKIRERDEKDRLKKLVRSIKPKCFGVIIRTVAKGQSAEELQSDLDNLVRKWSQLHKSIKRSNKPVRIFREMNRASAFLRDVFNESFTSITIDNKDLCEEVKDYLDEIKPGASKMVKEYSGQMPLFQFSSVDRQIKGAFGRSVSMTKGAYLIIEHTEALHVVDVNSGNRTNTADNQESNALQVNLFSSNVVADDMAVSTIFDGIDLLITSDDGGNYYVPSFGVDSIEEINPVEAYSAFLQGMNGATISIEGTPVDPSSTIHCEALQVNMMPFLLDDCMSTGFAFAGLEDDILIVSDDSGGYYVPGFGVNTLGQMCPGGGYEVFLIGMDFC